MKGLGSRVGKHTSSCQEKNDGVNGCSVIDAENTQDGLADIDGL